MNVWQSNTHVESHACLDNCPIISLNEQQVFFEIEADSKSKIGVDAKTRIFARYEVFSDSVGRC